MAPDLAKPLRTSPSPAHVLMGLRASMSVACIVLCASFFGFGAFARDAGFAVWHIAALGLMVWALPSCVIFVTTMASGASVFAATLAVALSAVRLMPMTVAMTPLLKDERVSRAWFIAATHFVAVTGYVEGMIRLPKIAPENRVSFFLGLGSGLMLSATATGIVGFLLAGALPPTLAAGLVFLTPIYFLLSMFTAAGGMAEKFALGLGFVLGPIAYQIDRQFDLLYAGIIGGTIGFALDFWLRRMRRARS